MKIIINSSLVLVFLNPFYLLAQRAQWIDWKQFLSRNDLVYDTLTSRWEDGVFTGNGLLGAMLYMKDANSLRLEIGRTDVTDNRMSEPNFMYQQPRLPVGHFVLKPKGTILKNTARLDLWNAEANGIIETTLGKIEWRMLTLSLAELIVIETKHSDKEKISISFLPDSSISARIKFNRGDTPLNYKANPAPGEFIKNNIRYCQQTFLSQGDYTTAWRIVDNGLKQTTFISIAIDKKKSSVDEVTKTIQQVSAGFLQKQILAHRNWWHAFYPKSFLSIPDARMESFYWIQLYKIASATRQNTPPLDLMGPWYRYTPWAFYWFNLNVQLSYSPLYTANHLDIASRLVKMMDDAKENLNKNVPEEYRKDAAAVGRFAPLDLYKPVNVHKQGHEKFKEMDLELGNLTWTLYYYWLQYRYTMSEELKRGLTFHLRRSINYYLAVLEKDADGKWHLPYTYSPEYPNGTTRDCNYDLSLLRWGLQTLLKLSPKDSLAAKWIEVKNNLVEYPLDENGFRIGRDVAFNTSHRHFSHLLMIYPLYLVHGEQLENRELITKSLNHWHRYKDALQGYTFTGGASINAMMREGDLAYKNLNHLFDRFVKTNTMYLETGPVIETPLAAATSIQEMVLQFWNDCIRIFPALPHRWNDISFENFRTQGAFLVSAVKKDGAIKWVKIKSLVGEPCTIDLGEGGDWKIKGQANEIKKIGEGRYSFRTQKGQEIIFYKTEKDLRAKLTAVKLIGQQNFWGIKTK